MTNNTVKPLAIRVEEALTNILVAMQKRVVLTQDLQAIAEKYSTDESTVMLALGNGTGGSIIDAYGSSIGAVSAIAGMAQRFPDLKQNTTYQQLMSEISVCEDDLQRKREAYNSCVANYNTPIQQFPMAVIAPAVGLEPAEFWQSNEAADLARLKSFKTNNEALKKLLSSAVASATRGRVGATPAVPELAPHPQDQDVPPAS
jgi:LemA protein